MNQLCRMSHPCLSVCPPPLGHCQGPCGPSLQEPRGPLLLGSLELAGGPAPGRLWALRLRGAILQMLIPPLPMTEEPPSASHWLCSDSRPTSPGVRASPGLPCPTPRFKLLWTGTDFRGEVTIPQQIGNNHMSDCPCSLVNQGTRRAPKLLQAESQGPCMHRPAGEAELAS